MTQPEPVRSAHRAPSRSTGERTDIDHRCAAMSGTPFQQRSGIKRPSISSARTAQMVHRAPRRDRVAVGRSLLADPKAAPRVV
ncbi:Uncharacterised protein [Mycobacteroides abscessus subsp. abscessus]|nr:Uncharacterised protein [Mycobacteroides abscessus subsp. abscessus]